MNPWGGGGPIQDEGFPEELSPLLPQQNVLRVGQRPRACPLVLPLGFHLLWRWLHPILMGRQWVCDMSSHEWRFRPGLLTTSRNLTVVVGSVPSLMEGLVLPLLVWSGSCSLQMSGNPRHEEQSFLASFSGAFDNGPVSLKKGTI